MPRGIRKVVDTHTLRSAELRAAIVDAVQECGRINGWANRYGETPISVWKKKISEDMVIAPNLSHWLRDDRKIPWTVEPLVLLAKIMSSYGVLVDGLPMPPDYFLRVVSGGDCEQRELDSTIKPSSPQWVKAEIKRMRPADRADLLPWLARYAGREWRNSKEIKTAK